MVVTFLLKDIRTSYSSQTYSKQKENVLRVEQMKLCVILFLY